MAVSAGGIVAGKAFILIEGVDKTGTVLALVGDKIKGLGDGLASAGRGLMDKGFAAAEPIKQSVLAFANFDDAMLRVEARSSGTAAEMEELREQAKMLGRTTSHTAQEIANMMGGLAQRGFSRSQIKEMVPHVRNLAQAAGSGDTEADSRVAADLVSGTLRSYEMDASESARLANVFTAAVNNSNFTLEGLYASMSDAAPIAQQYGLSLEDTVATLAGMTNVNISAAEAGTAFKNILLNTSNAAKQAAFNAELFAETGKEIQFTDAEGNLRPIPEILDEVGEALEGVGTAKKGDLFRMLFGQRAITGAMAAANAMGQGGFSELRDTLGAAAVGDEAKRVAEEMGSGAGGALRRFWSAVEGVQLAVGDKLSGAFGALIDKIGNALVVLTEWIDENGEMVMLVAMAVAGIIALGAALTGTGVVIGLVGSVMTTIGTTLMMLTAIGPAIVGGMGAALTAIAPIVLVIGGLTASIALALASVGQLGSALASLGEVFGSIMDTGREIGTTLAETFGGVIAALSIGELGLAWDVGLAGLKLAWFQFTDALQTGWENVSIFLREVWAGTGIVLRTAWLKIQRAITDGILALGEYVAGMIEKIPGAEKFLGGSGMSSEDLAQARRYAQEDYDRRVAAINGETGNDLTKYKAEVEAQRTARREAIEARQSAQAGLASAVEQTEVEAQTNAYADMFAAAMKESAAAATEKAVAQAGLLSSGAEESPPLSGITLSANEAIERGSIEAARIIANERVRDMTQKQLLVLERIAANTDPHNNWMDDDAEGV